jgi:hypothetical protein
MAAELEVCCRFSNSSRSRRSRIRIRSSSTAGAVPVPAAAANEPVREVHPQVLREVALRLREAATVPPRYRQIATRSVTQCPQATNRKKKRENV